MAGTTTFILNVDDKERRIEALPDATLLTVLRDGLHVISPKRGCNQGVCGSCTVMIDGTPQRACLTLAASCEGKNVRSIEGFRDDEKMMRLQDSFQKSGAVQCGFCTSGMLISAHWLLQNNSSPSVQDVQAALSGNLCRCTGYRKIVDGVIAAAEEMSP